VAFNPSRWPGFRAIIARWRGAPTEAWALGLSGLSFCIPILAVAYAGSFMRLSGDDYCFGAVVTQHGFFGAQVYSYVGQPPFHGDRYSATLFASLVILGGRAAWAGWTALSLLGWVAASTWAGTHLAAMARVTRPLLVAAVASVSAVFLTVYQAPDRAQSVYWWSANILYLTPLAVQWLVLGLVMWQARQARTRFVPLSVTSLLAFLAGGFSEATAAFQATWIILALLIVVIGVRRHDPTRRRLIAGLVAGCLGAAASIVALAASPYSRAALADLASLPRLEVLLSALRGGFGFLRETLQGLPVPTAVTVVLGGLGMVLLTAGQGSDRPLRPSWWIVVFAGLVGSVVLAASVLAPALYAYGFLPNARSLLGARHSMVLGLLAVGAAVGRALAAGLASSDWLAKRLRPVWSAGFVLLAAYAVRAAWVIARDVPLHRRWAQAWDARHAAILEAIVGGATDLQVEGIDHILPFVSELTEDSRYWYNQCAADYYGVRSITADLRGGDD